MQLKPDLDRRQYKAYFEIPSQHADKEGNTHLKVMVDYTKGGPVMFSDHVNHRGYRVAFRRLQLRENCERFLLLGGGRGDSGAFVLEITKSYSAKTLTKWAERVEPVLSQLVEAILAWDEPVIFGILGDIGPVACCGKMTAPAPAAPPPVKELLTEELKDKLRAAGLDGQHAICKFFNPAGGGTWIISGMDTDNDTLWCLADLGMGCCEEGTVSLKELQEMKLPLGLHIERDRHFKPAGRTLSDFQKAYEEKGSLAGVS